MGQIYNITPFTLLDYPDELACIVWISGCNLRCVYCHNPDIVLNCGRKDDTEVLSFLESRRGRLTAVVFSGGEATFYPGLPDLVRKAKAMGFKTKLDTNGSNPQMLRGLVMSGDLDRVALDYKCPSRLRKPLLGTSKFEPEFRESLDVLIAESRAGHVELEIRTTAAIPLLSEADLGAIIEDLDQSGYRGVYWIQNISSTGEKTLGNIPDKLGVIDKNSLPKPRNFTLGFRNFPTESREKQSEDKG